MEASLEPEGGLGQGSHPGRGVDVDHSQGELGGDLLVLRERQTLPSRLNQLSRPHLGALHCEEIHSTSVNLEVGYERQDVK